MISSNALILQCALVLATAAASAPVLSQTPTPAVPVAGATGQSFTSSTATPAAEPAAIEASSYSIGLAFGNQLRGAGLDQSVSTDAVIRGLKEGLSGRLMSDEDKARAMQLLRSGRESVAARNRVTASEFLEKNGRAPGVTTTSTGLQYQIFSPGEGKGTSPAPGDRVTVHYRGRLLDGTEFDSSDNHAQAATFNMNSVIKGWREALLLMKPGAKWRIFVPPELAYNLNSPPAIPPGSLLVFDVELLKVEATPPMGEGAGKNNAATKQPAAKAKAPAPGSQ